MERTHLKNLDWSLIYTEQQRKDLLPFAQQLLC